LEVQTVHRVSKAGLLALRKLTSLQEFLFSNTPNERMVRECFELLPNLHAIACMLTPQLRDFIELEKIGDVLSRIDTPCTLQLRQLALCNTNRILENVSLPELQALELRGSIAMHPWFEGDVSNLSELRLGNMNPNTMMPVLNHVGRQLQSLRLVSSDNLQLDAVLNACPNLSELTIMCLGPRFESPLRPDTLKHLQTVRFFQIKSNSQQGQLLLQVLRLAPKLRSVESSSFVLRVNSNEWQELAELAEQGTCMRQLEEIRIHFQENCVQHEQRPMDEALAACIVHCPKLQIVRADCDQTPDF
jgi:hypothetical protein